MAHVDDGELEMFLDGALHLLPPERADEVRRYVAETAEGARRLEEARAIRARSEEILGGMGRASTPVPDFEAVLTRAAAEDAPTPAPTSGTAPARTAPPRVRRGTPLLWAASVAAALGAGWLARGALTDVGMPGRVADGGAPSAESAASAPGEAPTPSASAATPSASAPAPSPAPAAGRGEAPLPMTASASPDPGAVGEAPRPPAPAMALAEADLFAAAAVPDPEVMVALLPLSPPESWPAGWERLAPPVPGFPVLEVALSGDTTLVTQALPDGAVLELRYAAADGFPTPGDPAPGGGGGATADGLPPAQIMGAARARTAVPAPRMPLATDPRPGDPAAGRTALGAPGAAPALAQEQAKASDLQISDTAATLGLAVAGGWLDLRAPVADSVLRRWATDLAERRGRAVP